MKFVLLLGRTALRLFAPLWDVVPNSPTRVDGLLLVRKDAKKLICFTVLHVQRKWSGRISHSRKSTREKSYHVTSQACPIYVACVFSRVYKIYTIWGNSHSYKWSEVGGTDPIALHANFFRFDPFPNMAKSKATI